MKSLPTLRVSIIKLLLAALLFMGLSDVYANDLSALEDRVEEVERLELKDNLEEEKEFSNNDLDEDDALPSFTPYSSYPRSNYISDQKVIALLFCHSCIVLPPPER